MTDLTGKLIANTYKDILTVDTSTTNSGLDNNLRKVQDGAGNSSSLKLSQTDAAFTGNVSVNGNMTVEGTFQPNTINTSQLDAVNISATNITTDTLTAGTLTFQDVSVSSLRTGDLYAATISAGTISATNINATNITVNGDGVATSSALASVNDALVSIEAVVSSNIVFVLNAQASVLAVLAGLAATDVNLQNNINSVSATLSATDTQVQINANQIATLATSIAANASAISVNTSSIAVNSAAITSINSFISAGAFASAGTSATLETRIASASATLESHINTVSATLSSTNIALQTSIANSNSAIAALSATMATSINNSNTAIAANTSLITALSSTLESRIATVSSTMATSIAAVSSTLEGRIASVSAAMATSIAAAVSSIAVNATNIAANTSSIGVNATNIAANTSSIAVNATSIAANASAIAINAGNISTNTTNIAANTSSIAVNASNITALSATLETRINAVSVLTQTNKTSIAANASAIAVNSTNIAANTSSIAVVSALIPTSLTELGITDGTAGQVLQTDGNSVFTFVSAAGGGANIAAGTNIALTQNGVTVTETTTSATINVVGVASIGTSAALESRIATVSSTMATSIANSNSAIAALSATMATSIVTRLALAGGTMTGNLILNADPTVDLGAATKQYVDNLTASGIHFHESVRVENPGALTVTYNNGTAGVGATLTNAGTQAALVIDGITMVVDDRVLIYEQADATQNGVYVVTNVGSPSTNWVLTRSADTDTSGDADANSLDEGSYFFVEEGNTGAGESYICNTPGTITFGTTEITFVQFSSSLQYTAGTGININTSRVISTSGVATAAQVASLSATLATSIANVSATLESRIATVSSTMATSIANSNAAITSVNTRINSVSILAETKASAATSANLATRINAVSALAETKASAATSANLQTRINTLSATMATSINNRTLAITSVNTRINSVSVLAETKASAATSANLQTRINAVSATMATSIANVSSALGSRITTLSATMATSIANVSATLEARINAVSAAIPDVTDISKYYYTATNGQTVFSGVDTEGNTLSYTGDNLTVTLNGLVLDGITDYTASDGNSVVLATGATVSDELNIIVYDSFSVANALPLTGGTLSGNLTVGGTVSATAFYGDGSNITGIIPAGTSMLFYQAAAPVGWTKSTAQNNKALRVVSGSGGGSGGSQAFTTAFASQAVTGSISGSVANHTLTVSQIPAHNHQWYIGTGGGSGANSTIDFFTTTPTSSFNSSGSPSGFTGDPDYNSYYTGGVRNLGAASAHNHGFSGTFSGNSINMAVQYIDLIIATKD